MKTIIKKVSNFFVATAKKEPQKSLHPQSGVTMIEYVLIAGVLVTVVALVFTSMGTDLQAAFTKIIGKI